MGTQEKLFKGLKLITGTTGMSIASLDPQVLYFVRTDATGKTDGYLVFNRKKYATGEDLKKALINGETTYTTFKLVGDALRTLNTWRSGLNYNATVTGASVVSVGIVQNDGKITAHTVDVKTKDIDNSSIIYKNNNGNWSAGTVTTGVGLATTEKVSSALVKSDTVVAAALNELKRSISSSITAIDTSITATAAGGRIITFIDQEKGKIEQLKMTAITSVLSGVGITSGGTWVPGTSKTASGLALAADVAKVIVEDEKVIAAGLNDLDRRLKKEIVDRATAITAAINALDASASGESNYVKIEVTETDGKVVSAVPTVTVGVLDNTDTKAFSGTAGAWVGRRLSNVSGLAKVENIDKALKTDEEKIAAALNSLYSSVTKNEVKIEAIDQASGSVYASQYKLTNADGTQLGATINIAKDKFLKSVKLVQGDPAKQQDPRYKYLEFVFIIQDGSEQTVYIDIRDLQDEIHAVSSTTTIEMGFVSGTSGTSASTIYSKLKDNAVTTTKIADANVTRAKLASNVTSSLSLADSSVQTISSSDSSITATKTANDVNVTVNRETHTTGTTENGHVSIVLNSSGALYGEIYFSGDDVED